MCNPITPHFLYTLAYLLFSNSLNINLYQQDREKIITGTSGVRKEITPYTQKLP